MAQLSALLNTHHPHRPPLREESIRHQWLPSERFRNVGVRYSFPVDKNMLLTKSSCRWSLPAMTNTWHQCDGKMVVLYIRSHVLSLVAIYAKFCITLKLFLNNTITSCYRQCSHYGAGNAILQAMQYKDLFFCTCFIEGDEGWIIIRCKVPSFTYTFWNTCLEPYKQMMKISPTHNLPPYQSYSPNLNSNSNSFIEPSITPRA